MKAYATSYGWTYNMETETAGAQGQLVASLWADLNKANTDAEVARQCAVDALALARRAQQVIDALEVANVCLRVEAEDAERRITELDKAAEEDSGEIRRLREVNARLAAQNHELRAQLNRLELVS